MTMRKGRASSAFAEDTAAISAVSGDEIHVVRGLAEGGVPYVAADEPDRNVERRRDPADLPQQRIPGDPADQGRLEGSHLPVRAGRTAALSAPSRPARGKAARL